MSRTKTYLSFFQLIIDKLLKRATLKMNCLMQRKDAQGKKDNFKNEIKK